MKTQAQRIQNKIVDLIAAAKFPITSIDPATGKLQDINITNLATAVAVLVNEVNSTFSEDPKYRMDVRTKRTSWDFDARVQFASPVSLELFETDMLAVPRLARDDANKLPFVNIFLARSSYAHPVQQQSSTGTQDLFAFRVIVGTL